MKRKWSYAAAMMLAVAGGSILTGCIDNDEPQGILLVRQAAANLLNAKADAAQTAAEAEVAIKKIEAETEQARIQAQAVVDAAQAEIDKLQAQADAAKTQAEADKIQAEIDRIKAETDAMIADKKAFVEAYIADAEVKLKEAQLAYEKNLYDFEKTKADNADEASGALYKAYEDAYATYLTKLAAYNTANEKLLCAQRDYALAEIDLRWNGTTWVSDKYDDIEQLYSYRTYLANLTESTEKEIDIIKEYIADMNAATESDLYKLYEKYVALEEQALVDLATANADLATVMADNKDLYDRQNANNDSLTNLKAEKHAIPAYTFAGSDLIPIEDYQEKYVVIEKRTEWTYNAYEAYVAALAALAAYNNGSSTTKPTPDNYTTAVTKYQTFIDNLKSSLLDENDEAWTEAQINVYNRQLDADSAIYMKYVAAWNIAKKGYNNGKVVDASAYPNAKAVADTISAYNTEGAKLLSLYTTYANAQDTTDVAKAKISSISGVTVEDDGTVTTTLDLTDAANATVKADIDAYEAAYKVSAAADTAYNDQVTLVKKLLASANKQVVAQLDSLTDLPTFTSVIDNTTEIPSSSIKDFWSVSDNVPSSDDLDDYIDDLKDKDKDAKFPEASIPAETLDESNQRYTFAYDYLQAISAATYGSLANDGTNDGDKYDDLDDEAMLVDVVTPEMVNNYIKNNSAWNTVDPVTGDDTLAPWQYYTKYDNFGVYGQILWLENRIAVATAVLGNNDLINEILAEPEANLAALRAELASVEDAIDANKDESVVINKQIDAVLADAKEQVRQATTWYNLYSVMVSNLADAVALAEGWDLKDENGEKMNLNDYIEGNLKSWEDQIENKENYITGYIEVLQKKNEYQIALLEANEDTLFANPYTMAVTIAQNDVDEAKDALDFWAAKVAERKAAYEASLSDTSVSE